MNIKQLLKHLVDSNGSDLFCRAGGTPHMRLDGRVIEIDKQVLSVEDIELAIDELANDAQKETFKNCFDVDFAVFIPEINRRFRISIFVQRNSPAIVARNVRSATQTFEELNLPIKVMKSLASEARGLVLLTGTMGSGKSTAIASMIEHINETYNKHILTVEEPIEFTFQDRKSIINQRELGSDVSSYSVALRSFTLQSPDVIFISNIRDRETMAAALTAAETGVLVLSTLHTINASQSVERIINFFPPHQHEQIRVQLSLLLKGVISLRLLPLKEGQGRVPACETMLLTPTISRLIREGKFWQIPQFIEDGAVFDMHSFNQSLVQLVKTDKVSEEVAVNYADIKEEFLLLLKGFKKS